MRNYSMKSKNRKNHQRWLNQYCKMVNKYIAEDPLWLGRFVIEQVRTRMEWFEDGSGGLMYCELRFRDKRTGKTKIWDTDCLELEYKSGFKINDFIVSDCAVWENEHPYEEVRDYRNVK